MLASILLAATAAIGIQVTPAAYETAAANQAYKITITSTASAPETITPRLVPDLHCALAVSRRPNWATMSGPSQFTLQPHAQRSFIVSVGQPPSGKSELVALFIASDPQRKGGAGVDAATGTILRFSEPGQTIVPPCPQPKVSHNPKVRTIVLGNGIRPSSATGALEIALGVVVGLFLLTIIAAFLYTRRSRRSAR